MCINNRKWLKMFGLALLGLCLYLFDTGSDTWVGYRLIQNCHNRFGAGVLCLVYVLPGLVVMINHMFDPENKVNQDDTCISKFITGFVVGVFFVPIAVFTFLASLVMTNDESLKWAKR